MLKKTLFILFFYCTVCGTFSQSSIVSITVSPQTPSVTDTIYVYAELMFPYSDCALQYKNHTVIGNEILASTLHCMGMLTAICNVTDTFKIDPLLLSGIYTFNLDLSSGLGTPCTPGIVSDDQQVISFEVYDTAGQNEIPSHPEAKLIGISDLLGRPSLFKPNTPLLYLYSDGTVIRKFSVE